MGTPRKYTVMFLDRHPGAIHAGYTVGYLADEAEIEATSDAEAVALARDELDDVARRLRREDGWPVGYLVYAIISDATDKGVEMIDLALSEKHLGPDEKWDIPEQWDDSEIYAPRNDD